MQLREGEKVLKIYHHHPTPFAIDLIKIIAGSFPFFLLLYLFGPTMSTKAYVIAHLIVILLFTLILIYQALVYWLDRIVITNLRIIHIDWKYLTKRDEYEADLNDIQDISTKEKGILSAFWLLDYGDLVLQTASHTSIIQFTEAPDPEGIRQFIYRIKPN
jgi:hypothetical protein